MGRWRRRRRLCARGRRRSRPLALVALRGAYRIIESREWAVDGAPAAVPGGLALARRPLGGLVAYGATTPSFVPAPATLLPLDEAVSAARRRGRLSVGRLLRVVVHELLDR